MKHIIRGLLNLLMVLTLYCCGGGGTTAEVEDTSYEHVYVKGCYLVEHINSDANRNGDDTNYFYMNARGVFCYSLKDGSSTAYVYMDDSEYMIDDFAVWNEYIYYVRENSEECELWKCNYKTGEETRLLSNEDITVLNNGKNLIRGKDGRGYFNIDVYEDYLYFAIMYLPEYICPIGGDILKDSFNISTLFQEDDKSGNIQQTEFEGIVIERYYNFDRERYETVGIRGKGGEKILYSYNEDSIIVDSKRVKFAKEAGTSDFQYSIDGEAGQHDIECLQQKNFECSKVKDKHLTVEEGRIIGIMSVSRHPNISYDLYQSDIDRDILFDLDIETGESWILYDTKSNQEKIIGYEEGTLYLVRDGKVYSHLLDGDQERELFELPEEEEYIIDWQAGYLIIRDKQHYNDKNGEVIIAYSTSKETEQSAPREDELPEPETDDQVIEPTEKTSDYNASEEGMEFLNAYDDLCAKENAKRLALIYLDEDTIPELLLLKDGEYKLYSFDGFEVKEVTMPDTEIKANAYGTKHIFEELGCQTFYWFEYVPYQGLIRVHEGADRERHDYYLKYENGLFEVELEAKNIDYTWHTYEGGQEIENEDFLSRLAELGYDRLVPCGYLYENVADAYENIDAKPDTRKALEDFASGKTDALDRVGEVDGIPKKVFIMRSYKEYYDYLNSGGEGDDLGSLEYIDFDNDGEDELILHGYTGACFFFDVIGDTVYKVLETSGTGDVAFVVKIEEDRFIARTDLTHGGREFYEMMKYDSCCCLVDWYRLYAEYEGSTYSENDRFEYRDKEISMEEFEEMVNSMQRESD